MPVGNAERGVGLDPGSIMLFADYNSQRFDWWHEEVNQDASNPLAFIPFTDLPEDFEHEGILENETLNLGLSIGLGDYWNVTFSQIISERCMRWDGPVWESVNEAGFDSNVHQIGDSKTVHHRTECSSTDFIGEDGKIKTFGGYFGDARLNFKYLLENTGKGIGPRIFLGTGLVIPSDNVMTESPWAVFDHDNDSNTPDRYTPHRHFYLSDGAYKMFFEGQFFQKRAKVPVFWGGTFNYEFPIGESDYGFTPSNRYELSLLALSGPLKSIKTNFFEVTSIGINLSVIHSSESEWEGQGKTPNSEATAFIPGVSILFGSKAGTFGINIQKGYEKYAKNSGSIDEEVDINSITISYRRVLDYTIDALYW